MTFRERLRSRPRAIDPKLHDFVAVLRRPASPPAPRERLKRAARYAAGALVVAAVGTFLWFPWPGLSSFFKSPAIPAMASVSSVDPVTTVSPAFVAPAAVTMPEAISTAHAEPWRAAQPPAPRVPEAGATSTALPPQDAPRLVSQQPPLPPMASLPPPSQVAMIVPPPELMTAPQPAAAVMPAWLRNALPAPARNGRPRIAIVIDDVGVDRARSARAIALPAPLTMSFLPYAADLAQQTEAARRAGHELLVHVPMEPLDTRNNDAGPGPLDVSLSADEILRRLRWDLARFDGYVGINNHMGSRFTSDADALAPVMRELRDRGLLFLDSRTVPHSLGVSVAARFGVPHAGRDVFLDDEIASPAIAAQLAELERVARRSGSAIAIGHPHDATLEALRTWLRDASSKGFVLVPLSAIVRERGSEG